MELSQGSTGNLHIPISLKLIAQSLNEAGTKQECVRARTELLPPRATTHIYDATTSVLI